MITNLDFALSYAAKGWAILPVWSVDADGNCRCGRPTSEKGHKPGKHPQSRLVPHGHKDATTDPEIINKWFNTDPQAGIGISLAASRLLALDIDPQNGGHISLAALEDEHGVLHSDCAAKTQGGGEHRLFLADPDSVFPATLGPGLDLKHRGYICAPPTIGLKGSYQWIAGKSPISALNPAEPSSLPSLILNKARSSVNYPLTKKSSVPVATMQTFTDLRGALIHVDADDYTMWINVGLALKPYGEDGYRVWTEWSARSDKFDANTQRKKWDEDFGSRHSITYRSIFQIAIENGWRQDGLSSSNIRLPYTTSNTSLDKPIVPFSNAEAQDAKLQPRVLVENYIFADLRNFIAAGGVGKTTVLLHESVCGALGRPIWGNSVPEPFTTVFVTKEDSREILLARLREIMLAMNLSETEQTGVFKRVFAVDLSGSSYKLTATNNMQVAPDLKNINDLIDHCRSVNPDRIIFDPLVSFTVGESRVNDAEQGIVEAARYLMRKMEDVAIDIVHHTGKLQARSGVMDQYAGRSGSALPDGCRMVAVMIPCTPDSFLESTGYALNKIAGEVGLKLGFPKMSYAQQPSDIFILRRGFHFELISPASDEQLAAIRKAHKAAGSLENKELVKASILLALRECQASSNPLDRYPSRSRTLNLPSVKGKHETRRQSLDSLIEDGLVVELILSMKEKATFSSPRNLGGRSTYVSLPEDET